MRVRLALIALLILGCSFSPSPNEFAGPVVSCADPGSWTPPQPTLNCAEAVIAARGSLPAFHAPMVAIAFEYGLLCPLGWYCPLTLPNTGYVIFRFVAGPPCYVTVSMDLVTGIVSTGEPQPLPSGL